MRLACFTNSYGRFGVEAALAHLPQVGVRAIELPIKTQGVPSFFRETPLLTDAATPDDVERVEWQVAAAGIEVASCNVSSGNPYDEAVVALTVRKLALAARLGVGLAVGGGGETPPEGDPARLWRQLRQIGDAAAELGIVYCCETHPGACQNADRMLETMRQVDHPHVRLNFDTGNLYFYNEAVDLEAALRQAAPYVRHLHLKETPGGYRQWQFVELGSGCVDFPLVLRLLDEAGFDGPCSLEIEGIAGEPDPPLELHQERVRRSVDYLRGVTAG